MRLLFGANNKSARNSTTSDRSRRSEEGEGKLIYGVIVQLVHCFYSIRRARQTENRGACLQSSHSGNEGRRTRNSMCCIKLLYT